MGWTFLGKPHSVSDWFRDHLTWESETMKTTCLKTAIKAQVAYAAVETINKQIGERKVWAAVCLLKYVKDPVYPFGYKSMDEDCGPVEATCPEAILKLLTETDNTYAVKWRARCWAKINKPKIGTGDFVKFEKPAEFGTLSDDTFEKVRHGKCGYLWRSKEHGALVRIKRSVFEEISYTVIPRGQV